MTATSCGKCSTENKVIKISTRLLDSVWLMKTTVQKGDQHATGSSAATKQEQQRKIIWLTQLTSG